MDDCNVSWGGNFGGRRSVAPKLICVPAAREALINTRSVKTTAFSALIALCALVIVAATSWCAWQYTLVEEQLGEGEGGSASPPILMGTVPRGSLLVLSYAGFQAVNRTMSNRLSSGRLVH